MKLVNIPVGWVAILNGFNINDDADNADDADNDDDDNDRNYIDNDVDTHNLLSWFHDCEKNLYL